MIAGKFKRPPLLSQGRLYELLTITKTVKREIMLERRDVPAEHGKCCRIEVCILHLGFYFSHDLLLILIIDFIRSSCLKTV